MLGNKKRKCWKKRAGDTKPTPSLAKTEFYGIDKIQNLYFMTNIKMFDNPFSKILKFDHITKFVLVAEAQIPYMQHAPAFKIRGSHFLCLHFPEESLIFLTLENRLCPALYMGIYLHVKGPNWPLRSVHKSFIHSFIQKNLLILGIMRWKNWYEEHNTGTLHSC